MSEFADQGGGRGEWNQITSLLDFFRLSLEVWVFALDVEDFFCFVIVVIFETDVDEAVRNILGDWRFRYLI